MNAPIKNFGVSFYAVIFSEKGSVLDIDIFV